MRTQITLYIDGKAADIQEGQLVLLTYQREDLTNPTAVVNSYSQQITLPGTKNNEQIFSRFRRSDRVRAVGQFDTMDRVPFRIMAETGEILQAGYIKLEKVERTGQQVTGYTVALYGNLGDLIYSLMYDGNGDKRSLGNMLFWDENTSMYVDFGSNIYAINRLLIASAWTHLAGGTPASPFGNVVNFAPCYNGVPSDKFSAKTALFVDTGETNFYDQVFKGGKTYWPRYHAAGDDHVLLEFGSGLDEWEVGDLRAYLQRPVFSLDAFVESLENVTWSGWNITFTSTAKNSPWIADTWMALEPLSRDDAASFKFTQLFDAAPSVGELFLDLVKILGLVIDVDPVQKVATILTRDEYYTAGQNLDISDKVSTDDMEVDPYPMTARYQRWEYPIETGGNVSNYKETYGKPYGAVWLDTGYPYDGDPVKPLEDLHFRNVADDLERSALFCEYFCSNLTPLVLWPEQKLLFKASTQWKLYNVTVDALGVETWDTLDRNIFDPSDAVGYMPGDITGVYYDGVGYGDDWLPKAQFCDAEGKPGDGMGALLFFEGIVNGPGFNRGGQSGDIRLHLSDDYTGTAAALTENPCWNVSETDSSNGANFTALPSFRRNHRPTPGDPTVTHSWDISKPRAFFDGTYPADVASCKYPFTDCWQAYLTDRYDADARVVRAKVDLSGFRPGPEVLQNFYWFDDALWVLNKVENWSLTTDDLAECEFIKVTDPDAYTSGQNF